MAAAHCLQVLSCHERLGVPLPQRTALQAPQLMAAAMAAGSGGSMQLHDNVLCAMADLQLHGCRDATAGRAGQSSTAAVPQHRHQHRQQHRQQHQHQQAADGGDEMAKIMPASHAAASVPAGVTAAACLLQSGSSSSQVRTGCCAAAVHADVVQRLRVPPGVAVLADVEDAAAAGPVGGAKAAYVMAKLLSAAGWKSLGLEEQPVARWRAASTASTDGAHAAHLGCSSSSSNCSSERLSGHSRAGGSALKSVLLRSGCCQPGHHTIMQLLGGDAAVLVPVKVRRADDSAASGAAVVEGWIPNLSHVVYQDLELT